MVARLQTFVDGGALPNAAFFNSLIGKAFAKPANNGGTFSARAGNGSLIRVGVLPRAVRPATGANTYVLDSSVDWRGRLAFFSDGLVEPVVSSGFDSGFSSGFGGYAGAFTGAAWPGLGNLSYHGPSANVMRMIYFGSGEFPGVALSFWHRALDGNSSGQVLLYAHFETGALQLDVRPGAILPAYSFLTMIWATEQLGVAPGPTTPDPVPAPTATDTQPISSNELNPLQDGALVAQFNEGDTFEEDAPDSMPLGPKLTGPVPRVPRVFRVRARDGVEPERYYERRQRIAGGGARRVYVSDAVSATSDHLVDQSVDWRDRVIVVRGKVQLNVGTNIAPGQAGDTGYNAATSWGSAVYTHGGRPPGPKTSFNHTVQIDSSCMLYAGDHTATVPGGLYIRNGSAVTRSIGMIVLASPQLGPRSVPKE